MTLRKFLYTIVILVFLVAAGLLTLRIFADELTQMALVPSGDFVEQDALADNAYDDPAMWFSRPGMGAPNDPARWQPGFRPAEGEERTSAPGQESGPTPDSANETPQFAVFFIHPTSFLETDSWNAPLDHEESQNNARLMVRAMASPFNQASEIWAPRYRQATIGTFITDAPEAQMALDAAYADVEQAFDFFLDSVDDDTPIVLAGHSQGSYHLIHLMAKRVAGTDLQARIAAIYPIGWPISIEHDLPEMGLPACAEAQQAGCVSSWSSFAEPADPGMLLDRYAATPGLDGEQRGGTPVLCSNPITGGVGGAAGASQNLGTLVPNADLSDGELVAGAVPARCDDKGLLLIGDPPDLGALVLPGNNYHVYDIPLFWQNLQNDVVQRVKAWSQPRS